MRNQSFRALVAAVRPTSLSGSGLTRRSWLLLAAVAVTGAACTDVSLSIAPEPQPTLPTRQNILGSVCAPPPIQVQAPYKLLFVVDVSGSTYCSDPTCSGLGPDGLTNRRISAVSSVICQYQTDAAVSYGIILFSSTPFIETAGFTTDQNQLQAAILQMANPVGGTDFSDTIESAQSLILSDIQSLDLATAHHTHYLVYFITDGYPNTGVQDSNSLAAFVTSMVSTISPRCGEFQFNTAFIDGAADVTDPNQPINLLSGMAAAGNGNFINIPAGQGFNLSVNIAPTTEQFVLENLVVNSRSTVFGVLHPSPDSDSDGLPDSSEAQYGTSPTNPDSDGDGYRDGFEVLYLGELDPNQFNPGCANIGVDTDQDNLWDCEEILAGTSVDNPDTDGDTLPDGLEEFAGSSPLNPSGTVDTDLDGFTDNFEDRAHTPSKTPNTSQDLKNWGYEYAVSQSGGTLTQPCYDVAVSNLSMYQTLATSTSPAGQNSFEVVGVFASPDGSGPTDFFRATYDAAFLLPNEEVPANGNILLNVNDMLQFGATAADFGGTPPPLSPAVCTPGGSCSTPASCQ